MEKSAQIPYQYTKDDPVLFEEYNMLLNTITSFSTNPNLEYIFKFISTPYFRLSIYPIVDKINLHTDGCLEISVTMDSLSLIDRTKLKIEYYKSIVPLNCYSATRYLYLKKTILYLKNYGKIILVRMPICNEIYEMEKYLLPEFDLKMDSISTEFDIPYLNLIPDLSDYKTTDGNHLWEGEGKKITGTILYMLNNIKEKSNHQIKAPHPIFPKISLSL